MVQERANHFADATPIPEIEALLTLSQSTSIVDRLMAMPLSTDPAEEPGQWEKAVSSRLQAQVVRMMRTQIEGDACRAAA
jgi:hypothetical protein